MVTYSRYKSNTVNKREKSLIEILHILYRRKIIVIFSVIVFIILTLVYSYTTTPVYEAKVVLKKEVAPGNRQTNEFYEIVKLQTQDEVETEMELVKTGEVLGKVVDELNLVISYDKLVSPNGRTIELEKSIVDYLNPDFSIAPFMGPLPNFISVDLKDENKSGKFVIERTSAKEFIISDAMNDNFLTKYVKDSDVLTEKSDENDTMEEIFEDTQQENIIFDLQLARIELSWEEPPIGSKFFFTVNSYYETVINLGQKISIGRKGKTNVFTVSVKSQSAYSSMILANLLIDKFRESRIEQQKQTIRYSFNFVDEQLEKMQTKLREAEDNLSDFKASGQITTIDASSQEVIKFLSTLEAEKMNVELELTAYRNKLEDMKNELLSSGYFDQSFLSPSGSTDGNDPFSALLTQLSELELRKLELQQKRTENHPDVINVDEQIKMVKQKLASYNQNTLTAYQIIINSLEKKRVDINGMMSKYEVKLERLPGQENKLVRLVREKDVYEKMFTLLLDKREEMRLAELSKLQDIIIVDPAREPVSPVSPKKTMNMMIALVMGGFVGLLGVFLIELKNSKLVNIDEIEEEFQIPVFSLIPLFPKKLRKRIKNAKDNQDKFVTLMNDQEGLRESFRLFKTKLRIQMEGRERIFMITSCEENTGKTTIVSNLAISFAQENKNVLIIDCDLRKAQLSRLFGIPSSEPGIISYLTKDINPPVYTKGMKRLDILPAGGMREDSSHLLNMEKMQELITHVQQLDYDYIILDTPPVTRIVDTLILGKYIKDAILIVRPNLSYNEAVWGGILEMIQAKIKIRGLIVNGAEIKESYYYRYRYGYGYGYNSKKGKKRFGRNTIGVKSETTATYN